MTAVAIVFAGGVGSRAGDDDLPKQFREVAGRPIIIHTLSHFQSHPRIDAVYVACLAGWEARLADLAAEAGITKLARIVPGGATSQDSIREALCAASTQWDAGVLAVIHDGVRPIITADLIDRQLDTAERLGNAVTVRPSAETVLSSRDGQLADEFLERSHSYLAQAPQVFRLGEIVRAHEHMRQLNPSYTDVVDSATLMARFGHPIRLVTGHHPNLKITHPGDVDFFRGWLNRDREDQA